MVPTKRKDLRLGATLGLLAYPHQPVGVYPMNGLSFPMLRHGQIRTVAHEILTINSTYLIG